MSDLEFDYYKHLVKSFSDENTNGNIYFKDLFESDDSGLITLVKTEKSVPWAILFFVQQIMINQRLRLNDSITNTLKEINERLNKLEKRVSNIERYGADIKIG